MGPAAEWPGRPNFWANLSGRSRGERLYGLEFLGILLLDLMNRKGILKISQNCSEVPKYLASRAAISGVIPRFSRTMSLTVGGETRSSTDNR